LARRQAGDVRLHHHVVRSADEQQVLHVVPAQQHELALPVEVVDVDDPEPRLPGSVLPGSEIRLPTIGRSIRHMNSTAPRRMMKRRPA
jgi:hypothetical protein